MICLASAPAQVGCVFPGGCQAPQSVSDKVQKEALNGTGPTAASSVLPWKVRGQASQVPQNPRILSLHAQTSLPGSPLHRVVLTSAQALTHPTKLH